MDSSFSDPVIAVRHLRPRASSCAAGGGCYHSFYLHARTSAQGGCCVVKTGDWVRAGQMLGYSGASRSGFAHLHFEIRDAPPADPGSTWQRECVHPLGVLPYTNHRPPNVSVVVSNAGHASVVVAGTSGTRLDVVGVNVTVRPPPIVVQPEGEGCCLQSPVHATVRGGVVLGAAQANCWLGRAIHGCHQSYYDWHTMSYSNCNDIVRFEDNN